MGIEDETVAVEEQPEQAERAEQPELAAEPDENGQAEEGPEEDAGEVAREFLQELLATMGFEAAVEVSEDGQGSYRLDVAGPGLSVVIGRQGQTLGALQYLVTLVVNKRVGRRVRLVVDAEGYRTRREEALKETACNWAQQVKETGQECVLDPMSAFDRRIVHTALAEDPDIFTYSEGDDPNRCVVISPKSAQQYHEQGSE